MSIKRGRGKPQDLHKTEGSSIPNQPQEDGASVIANFQTICSRHDLGSCICSCPGEEGTLSCVIRCTKRPNSSSISPCVYARLLSWAHGCLSLHASTDQIPHGPSQDHPDPLLFIGIRLMSLPLTSIWFLHSFPFFLMSSSYLNSIGQTLLHQWDGFLL